MNTSYIPFINKCFIGCVVKKGNKQRALKIYAEVLELIRASTNENPYIFILHVLENLKPSVSLWAKKVGGTTYKIPFLISEKKAFSITIHWLIKEAINRPERSVSSRLGNLLLECGRGRNSLIVKKKEEIHKVALNNRAFLKYNQ